MVLATWQRLWVASLRHPSCTREASWRLTGNALCGGRGEEVYDTCNIWTCQGLRESCAHVFVKAQATLHVLGEAGAARLTGTLLPLLHTELHIGVQQDHACGTL